MSDSEEKLACFLRTYESSHPHKVEKRKFSLKMAHQTPLRQHKLRPQVLKEY